MTRVVFLVLEDVVLLDLAGPAQVFREAANAGAGYQLSFVSPEPHVACELALTLGGLEPLPAALGEGDLLIIPGGKWVRAFSSRRDAGRSSLARWVRAAHDAGATVVSVCVGAFLLGAASLLDGRACTTHWKRTDELARRFPRARVRPDQLFVFDGRIATSAGVAAGIDLALAIVEREHSARMAATVARDLVVSVRRPGSGVQLSPYFAGREHSAHHVHVAQDWLVEHPSDPYSLHTLAAEAGLSPRTLTRQFKAATGQTIKEYATTLRLEQARALLRDKTLTIDDVAERCGFSDGRQLRRLWSQTFGLPPSAERLSSASSSASAA